MKDKIEVVILSKQGTFHKAEEYDDICKVIGDKVVILSKQGTFHKVERHPFRPTGRI